MYILNTQMCIYVVPAINISCKPMTYSAYIISYSACTCA